MSNKNIEDLCTYIKNNKAQMYAIENKMLTEETDFLINGYLKMLGVILQQAEEISEAQLYLYRRIVAGTPCDKSAEDYLRMALAITIEEYLEFAAELKELDVRYRFIFDAMLLSCVSEKQFKQLELVAEFSEELKINKIEMEYLATMAKCILRINSSDYVDADEIKPDSIPNDMFDDYIKLLSNSCVLRNDNMTILHPSCAEDVDISKLNMIANVNTPQIKLRSVKIDISEFPLVFSNHKKVIIDGCEFLNGDKCSDSIQIDFTPYNAVITFDNCDEVIITNSVFRDFTSRPIRIISACKITIINTCFENCMHEINSDRKDWLVSGSVIRADKMRENNPIIIKDCYFYKCGGRNKRNYYRSQFICNHNVEVSNSRFCDCWNYHSNSEIDPECEKRTMFAPGSKALNCQFDNCATFCENENS